MNQKLRLIDLPHAPPGFISYRYEGIYGYIMLAARNDELALIEAGKKIPCENLTIDLLEVWDGKRYITMPEERRRRDKLKVFI